ncbi:hypothetical protein AB0B66_22460 [Catellatospora sp. NPDC049111]|uniref:hypothetical protein n=1 Tax=Catellatospora sp. NPDC049111 TaxID=3155271 RepID=UPI0033FF3F3A
MLTAGVLLAAGALAACSESVANDPAAAQRAQAAYDAGVELKRLVLDAENTLVERCMAHKGFPQYDHEDGPPSTRPSFESPPLESAQLLGYGLDPRRRAVPDSKAAPTAWDKLPDDEKGRYTRAKFGDMDHDVITYDFGDGKVSSPRGGCVGETRIAIYGDLQEHMRMNWLVTNQFKAIQSEYLRNDADLSDALKQWSTCMVSREFRDLANPGDARTAAGEFYKGLRPEDGPGLDRAKEKEIRLAVADAQCADSTNLRATSQQARARALGDVLTRHEVDIIAWRDFMSKALAVAQEMLAKA